jgi:hypothetical protein
VGAAVTPPVGVTKVSSLAVTLDRAGEVDTPVTAGSLEAVIAPVTEAVWEAVLGEAAVGICRLVAGCNHVLMGSCAEGSVADGAGASEEEVAKPK